MAEIIDEAGLPPGVFNLITGHGGSIGKLLATHAGINKIAITGSTNTGRQIIKDSADTFKHVTVELGGKSPNIIFADADLDNAVDAAMMSGLYFNKGEICYAGSRLLVEEPVYDEVVSILVEKIKKTNTGNPLDPSTDMGPIADKEEYDKILRYIEIGQKEDKATLAAGGKPLNKHSGKGYYIEPTLFTNANNQMRIARASRGRNYRVENICREKMSESDKMQTISNGMLVNYRYGRNEEDFTGKNQQHSL